MVSIITLPVEKQQQHLSVSSIDMHNFYSYSGYACCLKKHNCAHKMIFIFIILLITLTINTLCGRYQI